MSPILDMQRRLHETGRIRIGAQVAASNGKKRPAKLESLRFTSSSEEAIRAVARLYGGEAHPWTGAPNGKQWEVFSESDHVRVLVPPEAMSFTQAYELWKGGGCERRCDGLQQVPSGDACACDPEKRECKPHTRLSVMLTEMPSSGLWRLDTQGFYAATELAGGFELARLIASASGRSVQGASLRLDQREVKRPGQPVRRFAVPVLDFDVDPGTLAGETAAGIAPPAVTPVPALPAPSLAEQLQAVDNPAERPRRANAAEPIKPTGLAPRPAQAVVSGGDEPCQEPPEAGAPTIVDAVPPVPQSEPGEIVDMQPRAAETGATDGDDEADSPAVSAPPDTPEVTAGRTELLALLKQMNSGPRLAWARTKGYPRPDQIAPGQAPPTWTLWVGDMEPGKVLGRLAELRSKAEGVDREGAA